MTCVLSSIYVAFKNFFVCLLKFKRISYVNSISIKCHLQLQLCKSWWMTVNLGGYGNVDSQWLTLLL